MTKVCKRLELKQRLDRLIRLRGVCSRLMTFYNNQRNHIMTIIMENRFERVKNMIDEVRIELGPLESERLSELKNSNPRVIYSKQSPTDVAFLSKHYESWMQ